MFLKILHSLPEAEALIRELQDAQPAGATRARGLLEWQGLYDGAEKLPE